jgi:hypothetical protein
MKLLIVAVATASAFGLSRLAPSHTTVSPSTGCLALTTSNAREVLAHARAYVSSPIASAVRAEHNVPQVNADSVGFYTVIAACDSAEVSYRAFRVARGDPNVVIPVALLRLGGGSGLFLGTALIGENGRGREWVVYNGDYSIRKVFSLF